MTDHSHVPYFYEGGRFSQRTKHRRCGTCLVNIPALFFLHLSRHILRRIWDGRDQCEEVWPAASAGSLASPHGGWQNSSLALPLGIGHLPHRFGHLQGICLLEIGLVLQNQERSSKGIILRGLLITYSSGIRAQQSWVCSQREATLKVSKTSKVWRRWVSSESHAL